jgi:ABC-type branched-subunit amino acid transport system substrate-binding protein
MLKPPHLSVKEKSILSSVSLITIGVLLIWGILTIINNGTLVNSIETDYFEIAVLVPINGPHSNLAESVISSVEYALANPPDKFKLNKKVKFVYYDTRNTANGAYRAAKKASRNPSTLAILGPLSTRELVAVIDAVKDKKIPIFTPASCAPFESEYQYVYRFPAKDDIHGEALVSFLKHNLIKTNVVLIVSSSAKQSKQDASFSKVNPNGNTVLKKYDLKNNELPEGWLIEVKKRKVDVIVILGNQTVAQSISKEIEAASLTIPLIVDDSGQRAAEQILANPVFFPVYLVVENNGYVRNLTQFFNQAATGSISIVGALDLSKEALPPDFNKIVEDSDAKALVYLGSNKHLTAIRNGLIGTEREIALVTTDAVISDSVVSTNVPLYYLSSYLDLTMLPTKYKLNDFLKGMKFSENTMLSYESGQLTWLILATLSDAPNDPEVFRNTIVQRLRSVNLENPFGKEQKIYTGEVKPAHVYIYKNVNSNSSIQYIYMK